MTRLARLFAVLWAVAMTGPGLLALLLLFVAATWRGHLFALVALAIASVPIGFTWWVSGRSRRALACTVGLASIAVVGTVVLVMSFPSPRGPSEDGAWAETPGGVARLSPATLLPEVDQLVLGSYLVGFLDPYLTPDSASRVRRLFLSVYRPMLDDPQFGALPSQLGEAYLSLSTGQQFVYVPRHVPGEKLPCVVFLHGSGGNFQGYLWVWKPLADAGRFVVVAPAFGFGNWHRHGGVETIETARRHALETLPIDPDRMVLAGLSNGGRGVMRAIEADADRRWKAVILLSAVVDVDPSEAAWKGRPVLVIHGLKDDRIAEKWFRLAVKALEDVGAAVTTRADPDEDHFLVFSRRDELEQWTLEFLRAVLDAPAAH